MSREENKMTRDEIMAKEAGPELDALVAVEVMGQVDFSHPNFCWTEWNTEDGKDGGDGFLCPRCGVEGIPETSHLNDPPKCCKHYSTDIAAAMKVVNKLAAEPYAWILETINTSGGLLWSAAYWGGDVSEDICAVSVTLPLAISRAALLAKEAEK